MSDAERLADTRRWLRYAREDLAMGESILASHQAPPRLAGFLAQQAAEKAIKACLIYLEIEFPLHHNLNHLRNLLPDGWQIKVEHPNLSALTVWVVEGRYPGDWPEPTHADAGQAVEQAKALLASVIHDLQAHGFSGNNSSSTT